MNVTFTHHMSIARQHEARARAHAARAAGGVDSRDAAQRARREIEDAIEQTLAAVRGMTPAQRRSLRETVDAFRARLFAADFHIQQFLV